MSEIRINSISIKNYRSFGNEHQNFEFPGEDYKKPITIVGYNNAGKTTLMNAILYGIGEKFISEKVFEKSDLHNLDYDNNLKIVTDLDGSSYNTNYGDKTIKGIHKIKTETNNGEILTKIDNGFFGANKHYNIFYINFHKIKDEISTRKTGWGNLTSFLAKHINKIVENDETMQGRKDIFKDEIGEATKKVLEGIDEEEIKSELFKFIEQIKINYSQNLRNNACKIDFSLPDYENIFLQMMFKIGLNGELDNLVPIDHFGDGYISMFVMSVVQAIAESNTNDKCLFLFEEPESFLHENHQEYFYKMVLCKLAKKHQVIYTTHSDKMVDIFDTKGLIRIEFDEEKKQTIKKYNEANKEININPNTYSQYNSYIKNIEPNLNKIIFSKKTILVEGPNDLMVYKKVIEKKVLEKIKHDINIIHKEKYAETYLNFENISIIPHHGKSTALLLIKLCKFIGLDYFVINDWDFDTNFINEIILDIEVLKENEIWNSIINEKNKKGKNYSETTLKGMITTNKNLINEAEKENIHFNIKKLETVIGYKSDNKDPKEIYKIINKNDFEITEKLFPEKLEIFLGLKEEKKIVNIQPEISIEKIPF